MVSRPTASARMTKPPLRLMVPPITLAPTILADRHQLAGHHRLVERGMAFDQFAVDRHLVARPHPKLVADRNGVERDHRVAVIGDADRGLRRLIEQRPDRAGGALARAKLQHLADAAPAR